jgi:hypothetical protein
MLTRFLSISCTVALVFVAASCSASKPQVPVNVTFRSSMFGGSGTVGQFTNQTSSQITITVMCGDGKKAQRAELTVEIPPNGTVEIGQSKGWKVAPGETVTLTHPDYEPKEYKMPWTLSN